MISYVLNPPYLEEEEREENPARKRRRRRTGRKARRRFGKIGRRYRRRARVKNPLFRSRRTGRYKGRQPGKKLRYRGGGRGWNPRRRRGGRRYVRRRRNPARRYAIGGGGMGGLAMRLPTIIPISVPIGGLLGTVANSMIQAVGAGATFFAGYFGSGMLANYVASSKHVAEWAAADPKDWRVKWARPAVFAASAGLVGGLVAMLGRAFRLKNTGLIAVIAAAGPGVRALGGVWAALTEPPREPGLMADMRAAATGLAGGTGDFLQVEGTSDFLQVEDADEDEDEDVGDFVTSGEEGGGAIPEMVEAGGGDEGFGESDEMNW